MARKKSQYATKQGRTKDATGKVVRGRARIAKTSPFHPDHVTDYGHRLARIALPALARARREDAETARRGPQRGMTDPDATAFLAVTITLALIGVHLACFFMGSNPVAW